MMILLAAVLLVGLIATNQARWTPKGNDGIPMEQITGANSGNGSQQKDTESDQNSPHDTKADASNGDDPHSGQSMGQVETNQAGFPKRIGNLKLNKFITGQKAINTIKQLHEMDLEIAQGYVANYGSGNQQIKLWVCAGKSKDAAARQVQRMTQRITDNTDMYTEPKAFQIKGINFWQTRGMGMNNYYYREGEKIYWLSTKGVDAASVIGLLLRTL